MLSIPGLDNINTEALETFSNWFHGQYYEQLGKLQQGGQDALADHRGKGKEDNGRLTENEKLVLENKRLKARVERLSTENALAKKIQELERRAALKKPSAKPSKNSRKKWTPIPRKAIILLFYASTPTYHAQVTING